jgi:hypothetical protein
MEEKFSYETSVKFNRETSNPSTYLSSWWVFIRFLCWPPARPTPGPWRCKKNFHTKRQYNSTVKPQILQRIYPHGECLFGSSAGRLLGPLLDPEVGRNFFIRNVSKIQPWNLKSFNVFILMVSVYSVPLAGRQLGSHLAPEDGRNMFLRNVNREIPQLSEVVQGETVRSVCSQLQNQETATWVVAHKYKTSRFSAMSRAHFSCNVKQGNWNIIRRTKVLITTANTSYKERLLLTRKEASTGHEVLLR